MKTPEQIAADAAAEAAEAATTPARSFRLDIEERLAALEEGGGAAADAVDEEGNSLAGKIRTFEQRILAVESIQAENTSSILRVSELVTTQLAGATARIALLEAAARPGQ